MSIKLNNIKCLYRIGLAIARRLAQDGARVLLSSRKQQNVDKAVQELKKEGLDVEGTVCHVGKNEDRVQLVNTVSTKCSHSEELWKNRSIGYFPHKTTKRW